MYQLNLPLRGMDSLTQIVLGAAVGEIALGRKIGNRAMVWGAIGGTIPDLDIIANPFLGDIEALAFHRGISHSIFFSVVAPCLFGWLVYKLYDTKAHTSWWYKGIVSLLDIILLVLIAFGLNMMFSDQGQPSWGFLIASIISVIYLLYRLYRYYMIKELEVPDTTFKDWYWLFFLAFATHWMLDSFTAFGTQIFQPFSDIRVAISNISVVDPLYTTPFLICVIIAAGMGRHTKRRAFYIWLGIGISSFYMVLTLANKVYIDRMFDKALEHRGIEAERTNTGPTIFNNILWSCVAEDSDNYYVGRYSLFDSDPNFHYMNVIAKNDSIHQAWLPYPDYHTLLWFSDYYLVPFKTDTGYVLADLRYGGLQDTIHGPQDLIFKFQVEENNGVSVFSESRERPENVGEMFRQLIRRIKGY